MRSYRPSLTISLLPVEATSSLLPSKTVRADEHGSVADAVPVALEYIGVKMIGLVRPRTQTSP